MFLDLRHIAVQHPGRPRPSVHGVTLGLQMGEVGVLIGPSGCGKTTLLRAVAGLERLSEGSIHLAATAVSGPAVHIAPEHRRVGMVFQDYALFPHMSVVDNVAFGVRGLGASARSERVAQVLALVGMGSSASRLPHELSGGQQQRVALARALAPQPHLLLLDEPFSNLDVEMRERLALEVRGILKAAGTTALLVTHDQHEAFALGDRVGVMFNGQLHQWDDGFSVYHRPATPVVAGFIGHGLFLPAHYRMVADGWILQTPLGVFPVRSAPLATQAAPDGRCEVLVRADDVSLDPQALVHAELVHAAFRGSEFLYTLRLASGETVLASVLRSRGEKVGDWLGVSAAMDHIVTFPPQA